MKDLPDNKIDEIKDLIKYMNPYKLICFYDSVYHAVRNDLLIEIPADAAEKCLRDPEFDLINLGNPPGVLPESCPSWIYTNVFMHGSIEELLQMLFDAKFHMNLANMSNDETISKN